MRINEIERKRTTAWPWLAGAVVLAAVVWGVTALLAAPVEETERVVETPADTLEPAAVPQPPQVVRAEPGPPAVEVLAPLGEEHVGEVVVAEGEVVATGTTGFWILTGSEVLRVDSDMQARKGEHVIVQGTVRPSDGARTEQIESEVLSRSPRSNGWRAVRAVKLVDGG